MAKKNDILLLHGFLGSRKDWEPIHAELSKQFNVITPDLPGHGDNLRDVSQISSFDQLASMVFDDLSELSGSGCIIVGYSLGGRLALELNRQYPHLCKKLVLISTSPGIDKESERKVRISSDLVWIKRIKDMPSDEFIRIWYSQEIFRSDLWSDEFRAQVLASRQSINRRSIARILEITSPGVAPSYWRDISALEERLTYIYGERDTKFSAISNQIRKINPRSSQIVIQGAGHLIPLEAHINVSKIIIQLCMEL